MEKRWIRIGPLNLLMKRLKRRIKKQWKRRLSGYIIYKRRMGLPWKLWNKRRKILWRIQSSEINHMKWWTFQNYQMKLSIDKVAWVTWIISISSMNMLLFKSEKNPRGNLLTCKGTKIFFGVKKVIQTRKLWKLSNSGKILHNIKKGETDMKSKISLVASLTAVPVTTIRMLTQSTYQVSAYKRKWQFLFRDQR